MPVAVRSPAWINMSPGGRAGVVLCVSEMHIMRIGGGDGSSASCPWRAIGVAGGISGLECLGSLDSKRLDSGWTRRSSHVGGRDWLYGNGRR